MLVFPRWNLPSQLFRSLILVKNKSIWGFRRGFVLALLFQIQNLEIQVIDLLLVSNRLFIQLIVSLLPVYFINFSLLLPSLLLGSLGTLGFWFLRTFSPWVLYLASKLLNGDIVVMILVREGVDLLEFGGNLGLVFPIDFLPLPIRSFNLTI